MRYIILILLILPIIFLALVNIITQYKLNKITKRRFRWQLAMWLFILIVLVCSFPAFNYINGNPILYSGSLSLFDIIQTTLIVAFIYILNKQRQKIDQTEKTLRDLHQELSIKLSKK